MTVEGPRGQFVKPTVEQQVERLNAAVAMLATMISADDDEPPHMSAEEAVERVLYPEHF